MGDGKSISLVLGSGGARGLAHIGIIRWLEENDYQIKSVSGSSIGALVGGIFAADKLDEFEKWTRISWKKSGLIKGEKLIESLVDLVGDQKIEDLSISYTAVAVDIKKEKELWIRSGSLFDAIRSSISIPLFFTPFHHNGMDLIDGGVLNPVPIAPTFSDDTDMTIAVNLEGPVTNKEALTERRPIFPSSMNSFKERISTLFRKFLDSSDDEQKDEWGVVDVAHRAFEAMQSTIARQKLAAYPPDHTIEIPRNVCTFLEFDRAAELIELGYLKAKEHFKNDDENDG
jgi:NTE family protein